MSTVRMSIFDGVVRPPVAHEVGDFLHDFRNVLAFDPVDRVDAFARAARVHADPADVARTLQQAEGIGVGGGGNHRRCRKHTKKATPRDAVVRNGRHSNACPVAVLTACRQLSVQLHPQGARNLWHRTNSKPKHRLPAGGQQSAHRQKFAENEPDSGIRCVAEALPQCDRRHFCRRCELDRSGPMMKHFRRICGERTALRMPRPWNLAYDA